MFRISEGGGIVTKSVMPPEHTVRLGRIHHPQIGRRLFSATTGPIFTSAVALSPSVSEPLNATIGAAIGPVVAENKLPSIFTSVAIADFGFFVTRALTS